jgi:hypothetical protein
VPAFFRAAFARIGAALAMVCFMSPTFLAAGVADLGTEPANVVDETRATRHECSGHEANCRTIAIKSATVGHRGDVVLVKARIRAMLALLSAFETSPDTGFVLLVSHLRAPLLSM